MNNNNNIRNIYDTSGITSSGCGSALSHGAANNNNREMVLSNSDTAQTTINVDNDMTPGINNQQRQQHRRDNETTRIIMETNVSTSEANGAENSNTEERHRMTNIIAMFREARHQLNRTQSFRDRGNYAATPNNENNSPSAHPRTWRDNLYEVLSSPASPRTDVLRAIFSPVSSNSIRYDTLPTNDVLPEEQFHFFFNGQNANHTEQSEGHPSTRSNRNNGLETQSSTYSASRLPRLNSRLSEERDVIENSTSALQATTSDVPIEPNGGNNRQSNATISANAGRLPQRQTSANGSATVPTIDVIDDADTTAVGEIIIKIVNDFVRYLPFIFIIFVKYIHDHLLGILDLLVLHGVVYQINKSLKEQIAKLNQKSFNVLIRDLILVIGVATYRLILSTSMPDPFGLLINPPETTLFYDSSFTIKKHKIEEMSSPTIIPVNSTISDTKTISLGNLLYYVAVNDLILKLFTQLIKIIVTILSTKIIRHKSRARLYALIEYISQFYRALVPMRQWFIFLFESYAGLEVISGILFSAFYMGAKGFEFVERGKPLRKSLVNFIRNIDYDRKPTKEELEAAGTVCPICHDSYTTPVVLECSHIFCDECVNTWFKREQTCPMCRAKVSEDPTWHNGATTYFCQLC